MNTKRFLMSFVAVYVVWQILSYLIHEVWLAETYGATAGVWRPEGEIEANLWIMMLTSAVWSFFFCYIFVRGYEGKGIMEGVRFGAIIGLFFSIPQAYENYAVLPIPYDLALNWFISGFVICVVSGLIVAGIYRPVNS